MLAGLPLQQRQAFYLQEAETYYYLNQVGGATASSEVSEDQEMKEFSVRGPRP